MPLITNCCSFLFYGWNHSPEYEGKCRACGKLWEGARNAIPMQKPKSNEGHAFDKCQSILAKLEKALEGV